MKKNRAALADPFDANGEDEVKTRIPVWLYPSTLDAIDRACEKINSKSRSDFLERAAQFYCGYIAEQDACAYLPPALATAIRGTVQDSENRLARLLFKLAVEIDMTMNVVAGGFKVGDDTLKQLRARCVQEVKKTGGTISFEDAVKYQRGK